MNDLNTVTLVGRLTRDAEVKVTQGGMQITNFSIAVNRSRKQGEQWVDEGHFFDCVIFGRLGEAVGRYLSKGKQVGIAGHLTQDRWEQDGQKRSRVKVIAESVQLLGSKGAQEGSGESGQDAPQSSADDDDVPF